MHANTIRLWKSKYGGMEVGDVVRLQQLEAENLQMQRIIARQMLKIDAMDELIKKKRLGPAQRQEAVKTLQVAGLSQRVACSIMQARRRSPREQQSTKAIEDTKAIGRLTAPAQDRPRYGCKRLYAVYEREAGEEDSYMNFKRFSAALSAWKLAAFPTPPTESSEVCAWRTHEARVAPE